MRSLLLSALILTTATGLTSCSNDKTVVGNENEYIGLSTGQAADISSAIKQGEQILRLNQQGNILTASTPTDKEAVLVSVKKSLASLRKLRVDNSDVAAVSQLLQQIKLFNEADVEVRDGDTIPVFFDKIGKVAFSLAQKLGIDSGDIKARAYFNDFTDSMGAFTFHNEGSTWEIGARNEDTMISTVGTGESWLLSPTLNLSGAGAADFEFSHQTNYQDKSPNRADILKESFKILVSRNYVKGDPTADGVVWEELNEKDLLDGTSALPAGEMFHTINTKYNLNDFVNEKVTIAFKFSPQSGNSRASWSIYNFALNTQVVLDQIVRREVPKSYQPKKNFDTSLDGFLTLGSPEWEHGSFRGNGYALVKTSNQQSGYLLSPRIKFTEAKDATIILGHIGQRLQQENIVVKKSYDYKGGDINSATWVDAGMVFGKNYSANDKFYSSFITKIKISEEDANKAFTLKFFIKESSYTDNQVWELDSFDIQGTLGSVEYQDLSEPTDSSQVTYTAIKTIADETLRKSISCVDKRGKTIDVLRVYDDVSKFNVHNCADKEEAFSFVGTQVLNKSDLNGKLTISQIFDFANETSINSAKILIVPESVNTAQAVESALQNPGSVGTLFDVTIQETVKDIDLTSLPDSFRVIFAYKPFFVDGKAKYFTWKINGINLGDK
ncbi:hypothetical protein [Bacteriovorax sp. DB6_IX]|uniref:hypothetical protein n=1 Tax=Bacteriovorax sp. DB6_IX TaxID=1353530 RepID=UPI00038A3DCA|nr:hypothetical protein [Bacteriovorax sp. DB6_IX]EQC52639.1 putative lipoprotein [Bacteriovorax sp. DB6_IX]